MTLLDSLATYKKHKEGGIWEMMTIAFPMLVAHACDSILIFTDRLFMARLDPVLMNASMGGGLSVYMLMTFFVGLTGYTTALSAQYLGAKKKEKSPVVTAQAIWIALAAYPLVLICKPLVHLYFEVMNLPESQLAPQKAYFDVLIFIALPGLLKNCFNSFFSGVGRTRVVMISAIVTMVFNVFFNYVLIFGKFGFPAMGIVGAAYGSIAATALGLVVLVIEYFSKPYRREFAVETSFVFDWKVMQKLLRYGYPAGLEMFLNLLSFTAMVFLFHSAAETTATAATVVFNWDIVSYVPLIGIEIGVTSLVGRYMGAGKPDIAHRATMSGIYFGLCYSAVLFVLFLGFPRCLINLFRPDTPSVIFMQSVPTAVNMLRMASLYVMAEVIMIAMIGALRGAGDTFWAMVLTVSLHWALVPVVYVVLHVFHAPAEAAWATLIAVFFVFLALIIRRYTRGRWKQMHLVS